MIRRRLGRSRMGKCKGVNQIHDTFVCIDSSLQTAQLPPPVANFSSARACFAIRNWESNSRSRARSHEFWLRLNPPLDRECVARQSAREQPTRRPGDKACDTLCGLILCVRRAVRRCARCRQRGCLFLGPSHHPHIERWHLAPLNMQNRRSMAPYCRRTSRQPLR